MKTTIYHPKTKRLEGTVTELETPTQFGDKFESDVFGCEDWHSTFDEAKETILKELQYAYSGKRDADIAVERVYARQESIACGNY